MTYAQFLGVFLCVPIAALLVVLRGKINARYLVACALVCLLAFVYTSPWDNYAAKTKLWTYDAKFAPLSHFVLYLPWEEYAFYFAQGILICLLVTVLSRYLRPKTGGNEL